MRSSPATRGRGTARRVVEGADVARTVGAFDPSRTSKSGARVAPSTTSWSPSPVTLRFSGEDL
ncbi:MAG: hypothetical protein DI552_11990 [Brevundimonas sp.]|nr:MAG: hypothetical protein DI552_11990 [Brevundimonas sp.]